MGDQTSNQMSAAALAQWDVPVTDAFIDQGQDWNTRQQIQYALPALCTHSARGQLGNLLAQVHSS